MCIIIDANVASKVFAFPRHENYIPLWSWIENNDGKIILGSLLKKELFKIGKIRKYILALIQAGRALQPNQEIVAQEEKNVKSSKVCKSNDYHVIALAKISGSRVLCTNDRNLEKDFTNPQVLSRPKGKIYKNKNHAKLLQHDNICMGRPRN